MDTPSISPFFFRQWGQWKNRIEGLTAGGSRRQLIISISSLAGSGLIGVALRFIGGIIQGRFIGPELLGYYAKFTILPGYLFFLHLGVFTSVARQYPYYIGKGDRQTALRYACNGLGWTCLLCAIHMLFFLTPCIWAASKQDWYAALGWGTQVVLTAISLYMFYLGSTYRNSSEFVSWSEAQVISSVVSLLLLPLVALYQFFGICVRYSFPNFISMLYAHWKRPLRISPKFESVILKKMIAFGAPLMVFAYISTSLWDAVERSYILTMMDEKTLGVYVFGASLCIALTTVATSISQVFHPRIAKLYGSSGQKMAESYRYCLQCSLVGFAAMLPLVALTFWLVDPLVRLLLPKYIESIPVARCLCWLSLIPVIDLPKQLLMIAKRTRQYGISIATGFGLFAAILAIFYSSNNYSLTLLQVVVVSVACKLSAVFLCIIFAWNEARSERLLSDMESRVV